MLQESFTYLDQLFDQKGNSSNQNKNDQIENTNYDPELENSKPNNFDVKKLSPKDLAKTNVVNANVGKSLQHSQDVALRENREEQKAISDSFSENKEFITKSHDQWEDTLRKEAVFDRMNQLEDSGDLTPSAVMNLLETIGIQPEWLKNPANEEYTKLSLDLLGGGSLQADYGSRVLQSEFMVAQKRIPSLMMTPEGRKQIIEDYKAMTLPAKLKHDRLQYYIDKAEREGKPLPHDIRGKILKDIRPQLEEAYDKFKQRNGRYKVRDGTYPSDNDLEKYYYIANGDSVKAKKYMEEDGFDVE